MAKAARKPPQDTDKELEAALRREKHSNAHDAAPLSAGNELLEGSPERNAKLEEAKKGSG